MRYLSCDHTGGEAFWIAAASLFLSSSSAAAASVTPLRLVYLVQCPVTPKQLTAFMTAVGRRQAAATAAGSASAQLEVHLFSIKGDLSPGFTEWLPACAGTRGGGLRALMLATTVLDPDVLAEGLVACAARHRSSHPQDKHMLMWLLDVRWDVKRTDVLIKALLDGGVHTTNIRIAGADITREVVDGFADRVSP